MKSLLSFLRTTIAGGILFLLPLALIIILLSKVFQVVSKITTPLAQKLPPIVFGLDGSLLLTVLILVLICFICGLFFRMKLIRKWIGNLEDTVLSLVPGYSLLKSTTADAIGEHIENQLSSVLIKDGDAWKIGFLVEEAEGYCTIFFPGAPKPDSGDVVIIPSADVKKIELPTSTATLSLKNFGRGMIDIIKNKGS